MSLAPTPFVYFTDAVFYPLGDPAASASQTSPLSSLLIYRPALFRRNQIRWIAACAWRARSRVNGIAALKRAKKTLDPSVIADAATSITPLIQETFGHKSVDAISCIPCGHSRRTNCFGNQLAQSVAAMLELPFLQIFADRPCPGVSHPKQSASLAPLQQIAEAPKSTIIVDDVATSGWHLEESMLTLRRMGVAVSSVVWISGASSGVPILGHHGKSTPDRRPGSASLLPYRTNGSFWSEEYDNSL
jgi:hypothetical protein